MQAKDVVIIGGGLAGLVAADQLKRNGYDVIVMEGRERLGGRIHTATIAGVPVDCGATWVGPNHEAVRELAVRLKCELVPQYDTGEGVLSLNGERKVGGLSAVPSDVGQDLESIISAISTLVEELPAESAWSHAKAAQFDSITFGGWLTSKRTLPATRKIVNVFCLVHWGAPLDEVSFFNALRYIKTLGGMKAMMSVDGGNEQDRILGSAHSLVTNLAKTLGSQVLVGSPVQKIDYENEGVTVTTEEHTVAARYAIVTASPVHRSYIKYHPALPEAHYGLARTWQLGALSKAFAAYERPFWRDSGLSGQGITDGEPAFLTFDVSPSAEGPGILMVFCNWRGFDNCNMEHRRQRVLDQLEQLFGKEARNLIDYADFSWGNDSFAPGGPNPALLPKTWTAFGQYLREPVGPIHWAGTETAEDTSGSMNGAILSGQRVAAEVHSRLTSAIRRP